MRTFLVLAIAAASAVGQMPLDRLAWLSGCWQSEGGNQTTVEMWMPPQGGLMVGASRTVAADRAHAYEHLRIRADRDHIVYTAIPSGQDEADFRSVEVSDSGFTVENLEHDFPQRIIYRRTAPDLLMVRVEGPGPNGTRGFDIVFQRTSCEVVER